MSGFDGSRLRIIAKHPPQWKSGWSGRAVGCVRKNRRVMGRELRGSDVFRTLATSFGPDVTPTGGLGLVGNVVNVYINNKIKIY